MFLTMRCGTSGTMNSFQVPPTKSTTLSWKTCLRPDRRIPMRRMMSIVLQIHSVLNESMFQCLRAHLRNCHFICILFLVVKKTKFNTVIAEQFLEMGTFSLKWAILPQISFLEMGLFWIHGRHTNVTLQT